jgi:adenosine deaminase
MIDYIARIPKAELHLHIEGTFEPELMFQLAKRNNISLPYANEQELRNAYKFSNLQDFLDIYYAGCNVLIHEQDFYDLTYAYFKKANDQNIIHTEIFFDPQSHTSRGIAMDTVVSGIRRAMNDAFKKWGMSSYLILSFLRHLSEEDAIKTLQEALPMRDEFIAVGLDSTELGNPPSKFAKVFEMAANHGLLKVAHGGEEGPAQFIWDSLSILKIDRLDHGNRAMEDPELLQLLVKKKIGLTLCPLSNLKLRVVKDMKEHPIKKMLDLGLMVTVNSDDPSYFGGYINENYIAIANALNLSKKDIKALTANSFKISFADENRKTEMLNLLDEF